MTVKNLFVLLNYLFTLALSADFAWPALYPEIEGSRMKQELCPYTMQQQCYIYPDDVPKRISHPILNGILNCDAKKFKNNKGKKLLVSACPNPNRIFSFKKCSVRKITCLLCKYIIDDTDQKRTGKEYKYGMYRMKENAGQSLFQFFTKRSSKIVRKSKAYNLLANKLISTNAQFVTISSSALDAKIEREFGGKLKNSVLQSFLDYYYSRIFVPNAFGIIRNENNMKYKSILEEYELNVNSKIGVIIYELQKLWKLAFKCNRLSKLCLKTKNSKILYYGKINERIQMQVRLDNSCVKKYWKCSQKSKFFKIQSNIKTFAPCNFAFVELESAFRIQYQTYWTKQMFPTPISTIYEPDKKLKASKFINEGIALTDIALNGMPISWSQTVGFSISFSAITSSAAKYGLESSAVSNLKSNSRLKFDGILKETPVIYVVLQRANDLQTFTNSKSDSDTKIIHPIFPPLSQMDITWMLYNWRFCWVKEFGTSPLTLYSEPPNLIAFDPLSYYESSIFHFEYRSLFHIAGNFFMPRFSQVRLYPLCGDANGETEDGKKDICSYIWFYDAHRVKSTEISLWKGIEFKPTIEEEYQYLLLNSANKGSIKSMKLGFLKHPQTGNSAQISVLFSIESNDWRNIYVLPEPVIIDVKDIQSEELFYFEITPAFLRAKDADDDISIGRSNCFEVKVKLLRKIEMSEKLDLIYIRPIIFPTIRTVKIWKQKKYIQRTSADNVCSAGFTLLEENPNEPSDAKKDLPGLMKIDPSSLEQKSDTTFCVQWRLEGNYRVWYQIGSKNWLKRDRYLVKSILMGDDEISSTDSRKKGKGYQCLKLKTKNGVYNKKEYQSKVENKYFKEYSIMKLQTKLQINDYGKITVSSMNAIGFEIRKFPLPVEIGKTSEWIKVYGSRKPLNGDFALIPVCKSEPKLKFEFEDSNTGSYFELLSETNAESEKEIASSAFEPFSFRIKITAALDIKCYGHFPYRISWEVKELVIVPNSDQVLSPPDIFLMVIGSSFTDVNKVSDTSNVESNGAAGDTVFDDKIADPQCIEKFAQRKVEEEDNTGKAGPNGQLALELDPKLLNDRAGVAEDSATIDTSSRVVRVTQTLRNPAQIAEYLRDFDLLKKNVCKHQPRNEICDNAVPEESIVSDNATSNSTISEQESTTSLHWYSWQNLIVYSAILVIVLVLFQTLQCGKKVIEQQIIDAQLKANGIS